MACCNFRYLKSLSGIFRLLTVVTGIPLIVLAWIAYFSSSFTDVYPEILAILAVEKSIIIDKLSKSEDGTTEGGLGTSTTEPEDQSSPVDIISDKEEDYLDEILLETLTYEKFFIGMVSVVFLMSTGYLILRVMSSRTHQPDSTYEIMFDFIFHVLCALGLLTGSGLVLLSAAKIQNFVDQVNDRDGFAPPAIVHIIQQHQDNVQDKVDKIAAAVIGMVNGIFYALCVVTIRMTNPFKCKSKWSKRSHSKALAPYDHNHQQYFDYNDMPIYSVMPFEQQQQQHHRHHHQQQQQQSHQNLDDPYFLPYGLPRSNTNPQF